MRVVIRGAAGQLFVAKVSGRETPLRANIGKKFGVLLAGKDFIRLDLNWSGGKAELGMRRISATFEIVTPMFLGGAGHKADSLRPTAIKAELVFWWRALNFARYVKEHGSADDYKAALNAMYADELALFGGAAGSDAKAGGRTVKGGQAAFILRANWLGEPKKVGAGQPIAEAFSVVRNSNDGLTYAGYGLVHFSGKITRDGGCFAEGARFSVDLLFRPGTEDVQISQIAASLRAFGLIGGLGARTRRGWGSVALTHFETHGIGDVVEELSGSYRDQLSSLLNGNLEKGVDATGFPLSALGEGCKLNISSKRYSASSEALDETGMALRHYRSWGKHGKVGNFRAIRNFKADHDWYKGSPASWDRRPNNIPERGVFGLPHNYYSGGHVKLDIFGSKTDRRASPLYLHVHKSAGDGFVVAALHFNNLFMPENRLRLKSRDNRFVDFKPDPSVIADFIDDRARPGSSGENRRGAKFDVKVLP